MDNPTITNEMPPQTPPETPPVSVTVQHAPPLSPAGAIIQKLRSPWAAIVGIIAIFLVGSLVFSNTQSGKPTVTVPTPTPTTMPTPTPQRTPSAISSQSAFISLDGSIQTLANDIGTLTIQDPSLSPPVLDLPLGYPSN